MRKVNEAANNVPPMLGTTKNGGRQNIPNPALREDLEEQEKSQYKSRVVGQLRVFLLRRQLDIGGESMVGVGS